MTALLLTMRVLHVVMGVFWAGSIFFINGLMGPSIAAAGPEGLKVMGELRKRRYFERMLAAAAVTVLSGLVLVWIDSAGFESAWFRSHFGMGISTGMLTAIIAFGIGLFGTKPAMEELAALGAQMAQAGSEEARTAILGRIGAARGRLIRFGGIGATLLLITVLAMATARYL
ncbi:MAG: hypothetical protein ABIZ70_02690 [Gemmatimonadales bacterium]